MTIAIVAPTAAKGTGTFTEFEFGHDHLSIAYSIDLTAQARPPHAVSQPRLVVLRKN